MNNQKLNTYLLLLIFVTIIFVAIIARNQREASKQVILKSTDSLKTAVEQYKNELHELNKKL